MAKKSYQQIVNNVAGAYCGSHPRAGGDLLATDRSLRWGIPAFAGM